MSPTIKITLDETTYYSILGLSSTATNTDIHKSYMKLARQLHPDKSKSDETGEQFKLISHAHSVLMDKDKKVEYDNSLLSKGLLLHSPRKNCHRYFNAEGKSETRSGKQVPTTPQTDRGSKNFRPYEQQPYGFGTEGGNPSFSHSKVPIFQSFNLKNYQRNQSSPHEKEPQRPNDPKFEKIFKRESDSPSVETTLDDLKEPQPQDKVHVKKTSEILTGTGGKNRERKWETPEKIEVFAEDNDCSEQEHTRSKMHKANLPDPFDSAPGSPFANNRHRHYARTKHEARAQGRRSVSPVKTAPTSVAPDMTESWNGLKNLLNKFNVKNEEGEHSKVLEEKVREGDGHSTIDALPERSNKIRKANAQEIKLDDLGNNLPINDDSFDMQGVGETLDDVPVVKRAKTSRSRNDSPEIEMESPVRNPKHMSSTKTTVYPSNAAENLYMPVNRTLPKLYKSDVIALDQYRVNSQTMNLEIPTMPVFQCNVLNKAELARCKQIVEDYNIECNSLKQRLLSTLCDRLKADQELHERLVKVENTANWVSCKEFDSEIVLKLSELQNRQFIVAQRFSNLLKHMYAIDQS